MSLSLLPQLFPCRWCQTLTAEPDSLCSNACRVQYFAEDEADFMVQPDPEPELDEEEE